MIREYYSDTLQDYQKKTPNEILGILVGNNEFPLEQSQRDSWQEEILILKNVLLPFTGKIYFEYSIPRMGKRIDVLLLIDSIIFVLEFKIGEKDFNNYSIDQVWDYALDLKNFHETSHNLSIAPILIATKARSTNLAISKTIQNEEIFNPIKSNTTMLQQVINSVLIYSEDSRIEPSKWENGRYCPTPTIIEAAMALYNNHSVDEILRNDAKDEHLRETTEIISNIIHLSKQNSQKSICFVTGVPGAGKTLVGLEVATKNFDKENDLYSVFLSGNGPLVLILREALARNKIHREKLLGHKIKKGEALSDVKMFIQNVHNFRDECLVDFNKPPIEHVALFDEAQRAWDLQQTANFMMRRKNKPNFDKSEPEFLISCLDRHQDWAVIICLVGGGQEINTGEAGIGEWIESLNRSFPEWHIYISSRLTDSEYGAGNILKKIKSKSEVVTEDKLHLSVSMRSFRSEKVSFLVKQILDLDIKSAQDTLSQVNNHYPIVLTRDLSKAKQWLRDHASGTERYGIVVSSQAERLKPHAIDVKSPMNPIHWFLEGKEDVRSSFYLEDVATEFQIQGLELDWTCITWDADFRYSDSKHTWEHWSFLGNKWQHIKKLDRQIYQKNAYRVLLTRARQGMVIVVPEGDQNDATRKCGFYDSTYMYLKKIGFKII